MSFSALPFIEKVITITCAFSVVFFLYKTIKLISNLIVNLITAVKVAKHELAWTKIFSANVLSYENVLKRLIFAFFNGPNWSKLSQILDTNLTDLPIRRKTNLLLVLYSDLCRETRQAMMNGLPLIVPLNILDLRILAVIKATISVDLSFLFTVSDDLLYGLNLLVANRVIPNVIPNLENIVMPDVENVVIPEMANGRPVTPEELPIPSRTSRNRSNSV